MPRPKPKDLPPENRRIWRAWQDAKQRDPTLTQGDFALTIWPAPKRMAKERARRAGKKVGIFDESRQHKLEREARARYLRLVFEGKRTPKKLNARADRGGGLYNVAVGRGDKTKSFNLILPPGVSRIDTFKLLDSAELKRLAKKRATLWRKMYGADDAPEEPSDIRSIRRSNKPEEIYRTKRR